MQVIEKTLVFALFAALSIAVLPNMVAFAQDDEAGQEEEEETVVGTVFAEAQQNNTLGYQDVERSEVIAEDGTITNPGGAGNEDITLTDDAMTTRPTNLLDTVLPQSTQMQEYEDFKVSLQAAGYSIQDLQYTLEHRTGVPLVIVRGLDGVTTQPNLMILEEVGARYGYALQSHVMIGGAWETTFKSVTGY